MKHKTKSALLYRKAMKVKEVTIFKNGDFFPICPHCKMTIEREYQAYCDRCGQKLKWKKYGEAKLIYK